MMISIRMWSKRVGRSRMKRIAVGLVVLMITLARAAMAADRPRNIFDDDWTPPKTAEKPRPPVTVIPPPSAPANPPGDAPKSSLPKPPSPKATPTIPAAPKPAVRLAVPDKSAQAAVRQAMKEVYAEQ